MSKKEVNAVSNEKRSSKITPVDIISSKKSTKIAARSESKNLASQTIQEESPKFEATNKIKEALKRNSNKLRVDEVLLIVLCFLLPPLAVYMYEGRWTSRCTLNLVLTLLCGIPGVIHALIVVLS